VVLVVFVVENKFKLTINRTLVLPSTSTIYSVYNYQIYEKQLSGNKLGSYFQVRLKTSKLSCDNRNSGH